MWAAVLFAAVALAPAVSAARSVILTPPYFNLAEGRRATASATCGEAVEGPELYCKLVGANADGSDANINLIQGQVCDYCDPNSPDKRHPAEYAVDGAESWWQSPPLSRGSKYNEVNLTIDLGQAEKRGSDKGDTATRIKYTIAAKRKALNWRAVFSSYCVYLWDFQR